MDTTIEYYNNNAEAFIENTRNVDFHNIQNKFLENLPAGAIILDFGCGSGRDTKYFLDRGYMVYAIDGSKRLCELAAEYVGIAVKCMLFNQLSDVEKYDGIWACSSLLHVPSEKLKDILVRIKNALKPDGIAYLSFKYGDFEGIRNGRFFTDMTAHAFAYIIEKVNGLYIENQEITEDVRPDRSEKWLNIILRKKD